MEMALLTVTMQTTQMSFVCFFAESRSGRNVFAVKEQELTSSCTFWLHESKSKRLHEKKLPRDEVVSPSTRYHHTHFVRKLADNLIRRRIGGLCRLGILGRGTLQGVHRLWRLAGRGW